MAAPMVRYQVAVSVDGFIAPLDGSTDWLAGSSGGDYESFISTIGGIVMGRAGFETELTFGPWGYGHLPVVVMTRKTLEGLPERVVVGRDPRTAVDALRARVREGDIWLYGGGGVAGAFLDAGLVDRVEVTVLPIVLGAGRSLFSGANRRVDLRLLETRGSGSTVTSVYEPIG